jgi:NADH-quinone oxidoreductase subunit G
VLRRALVPLPGAKADWEILRAIANRLGLDWSYRSPSDVLTEIATSVPYYQGFTRETLGDKGARWSFADERTPMTAQA